MKVIKRAIKEERTRLPLSITLDRPIPMSAMQMAKGVLGKTIKRGRYTGKVVAVRGVELAEHKGQVIEGISELHIKWEV
jgi:hypothetical protein